jgi:hypothetical protein
MTYKEIEVWIDKYITTKDYKSVDYVKKKLKNPDAKGNITRWIDNEGFTTKGKAAYDKMITKEIESTNQSYIDDLKSQIDKANKEIDLGKIKIDTDYEEDTSDEIRSNITRRAEELEDESEILLTAKRWVPTKKHPEYSYEINLDDIKDPKIRSKAKDILEDKTREAESEEEQVERRLLREIESSDDPSSVDVSRAITIRSEDILKDAIRSRERELNE